MTFFDWDDDKAEKNVEKHGVSFLEAIEVFDDPLSLSEKERVVDGELRWQTIGTISGMTLLLVAHTSEDEDDNLWIRIISARQVTRKERKRYEQNRKGSFGRA